MTRTVPAALALGLLLLAGSVAVGPAAGVDEPSRELLSTTSLFALYGPRGWSGAGGPGVDAAGQVTTSGAAQNEPAVAVNPLDAKNVLAGWNDYDTAASGAYVWTGIGTSHDGGATWNSRILGPAPKDIPAPARGRVLSAMNNADIPFTYAGDPILGFNGQGVGLAGGIVFDDASAIYVQATGGAGATAGDTFLPPVYAAWSGQTAPAGFTDKPWMRGDLKGKNFYVCWTHFGGSIDIWATTSQDGLGALWSPPVQVSSEGGVQGCDIGVAPNGHAYIAYFDFTFGLTSGGTMKISKSTDGGVTWGAPTVVAPAAALSLPNAAFRYNEFPRIAVSPVDGAVYIAWAEGSGGDVVLTRSTDGGATWSAKKVVNNDGTGRSQFFPALDVGPDGKVVVGFYDRRDDTANRVARYYFAESTDGGATFPLQYAASAATVDGLNTTWWFMGDYTDLRIGADGTPHAVFTASSGGNQDIYTN